MVTQQRNTDFRTYIWNFLKKAEKRLKRLTQQCNTDFYTSTFYHQKSWDSFLYMSLLWCNNATQNLKRTYEIFRKKLKKGWKNWRNNATLILTHPHSTTKKAEIPSYPESFLMQQRNTDFRTHISIFFLKSWEKAEMADATLIFTHPYSSTKKAEFPS